jgi:hypothetical protein
MLRACPAAGVLRTMTSRLTTAAKHAHHFSVTPFKSVLRTTAPVRISIGFSVFSLMVWLLVHTTLVLPLIATSAWRFNRDGAAQQSLME